MSDDSTSEGVATTDADQVHALGLTASDVTVAVIDIAFDPQQAGIADQVVATVGDSSQFKPGTAGLDGTAAAEVVAEMAPDANLVLASIIGTGFSSLMDQLESQHDPDVISMSIGYQPSIPLDGTDDVSQRITTYTDGGGLFVTSTGGAADGSHWNGPFRDTSETGYMEFDEQGTEFFEIVNPDTASGQQVIVQWDAAWNSSSNPYTQAQNYAVELYDSSKTLLETAETADPYEVLDLPDGESTAYIKIENVGANGRQHFDLFAWGGSAAFPESTPERTLFPPATSGDTETLAVGAVEHASDTLVADSARGPTQDGRRGVDIVGPAGTQSDALGGEFTGTSAACPHVAGVAALLSGLDGVSNSAVRRALCTGARAIDDADVDPPPNREIGFGYVDAMAALRRLVGLDQTWERPADGRAQFASPETDGAQAIVGGLGERVTAFERATGTEIWRYARDGSLSDASPVVTNGTAFVAGGGGTLAALNADAGTVTWRRTGDSAITASPTVLDESVFVARNDGRVSAYATVDGTHQWTVDVGGPVYADPAAGSGLLTLATDDGRLLCLDAADGSVHWTFETGVELGASGPRVANGSVYLAADAVYAFDLAATRTEQWVQPFGGTAGSTPAVESGRLFVGAADGTLHALDTVDGTPLWTVDVGETVAADPTVAGGRVAVPSLDGSLRLFLANGTELGRTALSSESRSSPRIEDDELLVGTRDGSVASHSSRRHPGPFVETDGTEFVLDGSSFRFLGANSNHLPVAKWRQYGYVETVLDVAQNRGVTVMRTWGFPPGWTALDVHLGPGEFDDTWLEHFDHVIAAAKRRGIKLVVPLIHNWNGRNAPPSPKAYADWSDTITWSNPEQAHNDFFGDAQANQYARNYIEHVLTHENHLTGLQYREDPTIAMWEIGNEVEYAGSRRGESLASWYDEMAAHITSLDDNHLVSTGMHGATGDTYESWNRRNDYVGSHQSAHIDACSFHEYPVFEYGGDVTDRDKDLFGEYISEHVEKAHQTVGKPAYFGEFGTYVDPGTQYDLTMRNDYFAKAFDVAVDVDLHQIMFWSLDIHEPTPWEDYTHEEWSITVFPDDTGTWDAIAPYQDAL